MRRSRIVFKKSGLRPFTASLIEKSRDILEEELSSIVSCYRMLLT